MFLLESYTFYLKAKHIGYTASIAHSSTPVPLDVKREKVFRKFLILGEIYCIQKEGGGKHSFLKCLYGLQGEYSL